VSDLELFVWMRESENELFSPQKKTPFDKGEREPTTVLSDAWKI
jgi:hypothetical protein